MIVTPHFEDRDDNLSARHETTGLHQSWNFGLDYSTSPVHQKFTHCHCRVALRLPVSTRSLRCQVSTKENDASTLFLFIMRNKLHHNFPTSQDCEAPDISLGPISHMFAYRLFSSMSYPNSQCLFSMLESNLRSSLVLTTGSSSFL